MPASWRPGPLSPPPPLVGSSKSFAALRAEGLVGISDRVLRDHLALYEKACAELAELDAARPRSAWRVPSDIGLLPGEAWRILNTRVRDLDLRITGRLAGAIGQVFDELAARGIDWRPNVVAGEPDFWTADQATTINVPWTLASDVLWRMVNDHAERYTLEDVVRIFRHEVGHALGYAFELWREGYWRESFGDFFEPYREEYAVDPLSRDHVMHLHSLQMIGTAHYAQKHPDEDWAETFAIWLDPLSEWRKVYADWPGALRKLQTVEDLIVGQGRAAGQAVNRRAGRVRGAAELTGTVAEHLGIEKAGSLGDLVRRRTSALRNSAALHELYFEGLARGVGDLGALEHFRLAVTADFGSVEAWATDMRACVAAADGWALCCFDARDRRIRNFVVDGHDHGIPAGAAVLLAIDCWEHAYAGDVGTALYAYAAAVWKNIAWPVVEARLQVARAAANGNADLITFLSSPAVAVSAAVDLSAAAVPMAPGSVMPMPVEPMVMQAPPTVDEVRAAEVKARQVDGE